MLPRQAHATLQTLSRGFPVVAVTGPRQSGKTTLAQTVFADLAYLNLEDPDTRELARADPRRFLARHANGMILDEVQRVPELLSYLLGHADATQRMGRIVLTGSQQLGLMDGITQSLAGRVGLLTLLPLSHAELVHAQAAPASRDTVSLEQRLELLADGDGTEATAVAQLGVARGAWRALSLVGCRWASCWVWRAPRKKVKPNCPRRNHWHGLCRNTAPQPWIDLIY